MIPHALGRVAAGLGALALVVLCLGASPPARTPTPTKPEHVGAGPQHVVYPTDQRPLGTQRKAASTANSVAPFLTRPYWGPHSVTSIFDHCNPDYSRDGLICDGDGRVASRSNGVDPTFSAGYAYTPGGTDYVYYDGHNGWDLALNYENLIAAAPGTVVLAGSDPYNAGFGETVTIDHGNGFTTRYAHMSQIWVSSGQHVDRGQGIGVSGNTGASTGPHLHFGLYLTGPWTAIDPWGWNAASADPWPSDAGDMWITGNPRDPVPDAPTNVSATSLGQTATVTWSAPGFDGGSGVSTYVVSASPGGANAVVAGSTTSATISGLNYGTAYTFTVTARNALGSSPASAPSSPITITAPNEQWLPWYDNASAGMTSDHIHLFNPGSAQVSGMVGVGSGDPVSVSLAPGASTYLSMPPGTIGGPVRVSTTGPVIVSQRIAYQGSLTEVPGIPTSRASNSLLFTWFDNLSPGMASDNVHLVNPGTSSVSGRISLPGAADLPFTLGGGQAGFYTFPPGTRGGPVTVSASGPLIGSQRTIYQSSLSEVPAGVPADAATDLYMSWYDNRSAGMLSDNVHVLNTGSSSAQGTIGLPGGASIPFSIPAGQTSYFAFPGGSIGGPVHIHSSAPVLATQRVAFMNSLSELAARPSTAAVTSQAFTWFDNQSPGMLSDNVHLANLGGAPATGTVSVPQAAPISFTIQPGQEVYVTFPAHTIGGPVTVTSNAPVVASQRVAYIESLTEIWAQATG